MAKLRAFDFFFKIPNVELSSTGSVVLPDGRRYTDPDRLMREMVKGKKRASTKNVGKSVKPQKAAKGERPKP